MHANGCGHRAAKESALDHQSSASHTVTVWDGDCASRQRQTTLMHHRAHLDAPLGARVASPRGPSSPEAPVADPRSGHPTWGSRPIAEMLPRLPQGACRSGGGHVASPCACTGATVNAPRSLRALGGLNALLRGLAKSGCPKLCTNPSEGALACTARRKPARSDAVGAEGCSAVGTALTGGHASDLVEHGLC